LDCCCSFHVLVPLVSSHSELTSETTNPCIHFGSTTCTMDRPSARPLPKQDNTTQKNADRHILLTRAGFESTTSLFEQSKTYVTYTVRELGPAGLTGFNPKVIFPSLFVSFLFNDVSSVTQVIDR